MKSKNEVPNKGDWMKSVSSNFLDHERTRALIERTGKGQAASGTTKPTNVYKHHDKIDEPKTEKSTYELSSETFEEFPYDFITKDCRTDMGYYGPKKYVTKCYFLPKAQPVSFSETVILTLGSNKKNYYETIRYKRSYKYMMYATKQPTLRISKNDLKCKVTECEFYGNAQWGGYCSKCYEDVRKPREKKLKPERPEHSKSQIAAFSKFEEKKRQQSDKKTNYFKTLKPVFRKSSSAKDSSKADKHELRHSHPETEKLNLEYLTAFSLLGDAVKKHFFNCIKTAHTNIMKKIESKSIDEIAEIVHKFYHMFNHVLVSHDIFEHVDDETREPLSDFFEKFLMTISYDVLFCPHNTNDEEHDLIIQDRIRKLSWVNARHLGSCISETSMEVRELVYTAITDLLGVDSVRAPQQKLASVVRCCRSVMEVLRHCLGGPVSADEFLPALIFIILKANPTRLKSNIYFVTRFCNEKRLMQGESGYYFTNLCCAVSFIENLTAESLNMPEDEFKAYMSGAIKPVSAWESALVACESMHQLCEHLALVNSLSQRRDVIQNETAILRENIVKFKEKISTQVETILEQTPLVIKPRKTPIDLDTHEPHLDLDSLPTPLLPTVVNESTAHAHEPGALNGGNYLLQNLQLQSLTVITDKQKKSLMELNVTPCTDIAAPLLMPPQSAELTPADSPSSNLLGLANINYDIDLSDLSTDTSAADELKLNDTDPFSSIENACPLTQSPLLPSNAAQSFAAELNLSEPSNDFLSFVGSAECEETILDKSEEAAEHLPSPIKPISSSAGGYSGFSKQGWQIPSIPCSTGDCSQSSTTQQPSTSRDEH